MQFFKKANPIYLTAAILILFSSCRVTSLPYTHTASEPYVQTKNGKKFTGTSAERSEGIFVKDKIVLGDTSFKAKDVAFYSTGGSTYANVGRKAFAEQVAAGKINLYKYEYTTTTTSSNGSSSSHRNIYYYIQKDEGMAIKPLKYKYLAPMVTPHTPEYSMLQKYKNKRILSESFGYGTLGLVSVGSFLLSSSNSSSSSIGGALIGVGVCTFITWAAMYMPNQMKLLKTVLIADKSDRNKGKHHRVN